MNYWSFNGEKATCKNINGSFIAGRGWILYNTVLKSDTHGIILCSGSIIVSCHKHFEQCYESWTQCSTEICIPVLHFCLVVSRTLLIFRYTYYSENTKERIRVIYSGQHGLGPVNGRRLILLKTHKCSLIFTWDWSYIEITLFTVSTCRSLCPEARRSPV
jgi:hypothetical protein